MAQGGAQVQTHHTWSGARLGQLLLPRRVRVLAAGKLYKVVCFERESPAILACKRKRLEYVALSMAVVCASQTR